MNNNKSFFRSNPNGTHEECNNFNEFQILFTDYRKKCYYMSITPCTRNEDGTSSFLYDFQNRSVDMFPVKRRNAKVQRTCEEWLERHVDNINEEYNTNGMQGVKDYFTQHWLAI